jgi:hypothetical protein
MPKLTDSPSGKLKSTITLRSLESFLGTECKGDRAIGSLKGLSVVYGDSSSSFCGGCCATGSHVPCPEVCSAYAQPEVAKYPP